MNYKIKASLLQRFLSAFYLLFFLTHLRFPAGFPVRVWPRPLSWWRWVSMVCFLPSLLEGSSRKDDPPAPQCCSTCWITGCHLRVEGGVRGQSGSLEEIRSHTSGFLETSGNSFLLKEDVTSDREQRRITMQPRNMGNEVIQDLITITVHFETIYPCKEFLHLSFIFKIKYFKLKLIVIWLIKIHFCYFYILIFSLVLLTKKRKFNFWSTI